MWDTLDVTIAEHESRISLTDEFGRRQGILGIITCFLDELALCIDWTEEKVTSFNGEFPDFMSHSVGTTIARHDIRPTSPQF
jgi:hypothetical protein